MKRRRLLAAGLMTLAMLAGCKGVESPSLTHPRSADIQQKRALRYDPYPENSGGPGMAGVRPREYQSPPAEPSRARWERENQSQFPNSERWGTHGEK